MTAFCYILLVNLRTKFYAHKHSIFLEGRECEGGDEKKKRRLARGIAELLLLQDSTEGEVGDSGGQVYCIFLFLCAASLFGTIIAQVRNAKSPPPLPRPPF